MSFDDAITSIQKRLDEIRKKIDLLSIWIDEIDPQKIRDAELKGLDLVIKKMDEDVLKQVLDVANRIRKRCEGRVRL